MQSAATTRPTRSERIARVLAPEIAASKAAGSRWDTGVARLIARRSVADWLRDVGADVGCGRRFAACAASTCGSRQPLAARPRRPVRDRRHPGREPHVSSRRRKRCPGNRHGGDAARASPSEHEGDACGSARAHSDAGRRQGQAVRGRFRGDGTSRLDTARRAVRTGTGSRPVARNHDIEIRTRDARPAPVRSPLLDAASPAARLRERPALWRGLGRKRAAGARSRHPQPAGRWRRVVVPPRDDSGVRLPRSGAAARLARPSGNAAARGNVSVGPRAVFERRICLFRPPVRPIPARAAGDAVRADRVRRRAHQPQVAGLH